MAIKYTAIELWEVKPILLQRGYRFNGSRNYGLQLTKAHPTKRFTQTAQPYRELLGGVSHDMLRQILLRSNSPQEAADHIEAACTGSQLHPRFQDDQPLPSAIDDRVIEQIVQNRTENVIAQKTQAQEREIAELREQMEELRRQATEAAKKASTPAKRKPGRPKGSKNKPKAADGDVELTDEQKDLLKSVNFGPQGGE